MSNDSPPVHRLLFTGCDYVTVSIIALCIGCEEKKKSQIGVLLPLAHVED